MIFQTILSEYEVFGECDYPIKRTAAETKTDKRKFSTNPNDFISKPAPAKQ